MSTERAAVHAPWSFMESRSALREPGVSSGSSADDYRSGEGQLAEDLYLPTLPKERLLGVDIVGVPVKGHGLLIRRAA
jgi:hypothetical protein